MKKIILAILLCGVITGCELMNEESGQVKEQASFIRTYHILNVAESDDSDFLYVTIKQFQCDDVQTIKVEKALCPDIAADKNYEFTIKANGEIADNLLSIFNHSEISAIKETDKIGLEQTQDPIPE